MNSSSKAAGDEAEAGADNPAFHPHPQDPLESGKNQPEKSGAGEPEEGAPRAQWGHGLEFLMSCIAMSVGLGNIWRFPFTAYENGGGAFLIPYIIILLVIGRPLYYMEMVLGQFANRGNVKVYTALAPCLKGTGYMQLIGTVCVATYYCSLMAITLFYLINSFTGDLPWATCRPEWQSQTDKVCVDASQTVDSSGESAIIGNNTISSSELFFTLEVLKEKKDISDGLGWPEWRLTLCLLFSWAVAFLVSAKGVESAGKASYFLALFPYVIMITLLIKAATLEGADVGMYYFIKTDWSKLLEADVWYAAVTQCFFSLNVGFGSIITFSSYNDFHHNINRDALIVTTLDTFTSLLSGVTIFGILGNLAHNLGVEPDRVISSGGAGLAFISYPDAISKMEGAPWLFAILFFLMLFVLGIGSLMALHGTMNAILQDLFPKTRKWIIVLATSIFGFLVGLMYVTPGGQFMLNLVDYYGGTWVIFLIVLVEVCSVVWFYGLDNFCLDIEYMSKKKVAIYWRLTWGFVTPIMLIIIFVYFCVKFTYPSYAGVEYPAGAVAVGWCILGLAVAQLLLWALYSVFQHRHLGYPQMVRKAFSNADFAPGRKEHIEPWRKFKEDAFANRGSTGRSFAVRQLRALIGK